MTNVEAMKGIVSDEIAKAVLGGPGAVADREELKKQLDAAKSPAQLAGVIDSFLKLMAGQVRAAQQNYLSSTKQSNDTFSARLLPETIEAMQAVGEDPTQPPTAKPPPPPAPAPPPAAAKGPPKAPPPERFKGLKPGQAIKDKQGNIWKMGPKGPELVKHG